MEFATHHWQKFTGSFPEGTVYGSDSYAVGRGWHNNEWIPGKVSTGEKKTYVPWGGKEVETKEFEVLVAAPGTSVHWVKASNGQVPVGTVGPIGADNLYIARALCPQPENVHTPGKIHPANGKFYLPWGGVEHEYKEYEALVIHPKKHSWVKWQGVVPANAVFASDRYIVIKGWHNNEFIPGKLHTTENKAYVPWGGKETEVTEFDVLTHAPGTHLEWVKASHGHVPEGAIGPIGNDNLFVGRAVCPAPENKYTPGKVHPSEKKFYIPWGGVEHEFHDYEVLVIKRDDSHFHFHKF